MSFEPYKDWEPGDEPEDVRELIRRQQIELESQRETIRNIAECLGALNGQDQALKQMVDLQTKQIDAMSEAIIAQNELLQNLWTFIRCVTTIKSLTS
jgi:ABC-type transporter Mla subunit MlaD